MGVLKDVTRNGGEMPWEIVRSTWELGRKPDAPRCDMGGAGEFR